MRCLTIADLPPPPPGRTGWPWTEQGPSEEFEPDDGVAVPRISITTPSYNQAPYLEETIRSVLLQNYCDLEYFVIDGGSTDGSVDIIRKYESWLTGWISEPDDGQSAAINKGWRRSSGELIAWLNSDDAYEPGALFKIATFAVGNPDVELMYGDCWIVDQEGRPVRMAPADSFDLARLLADDWIIPQQSAFVRRTVYDDLGGVDESLHYVMDWEYWLRIALAGRRIRYTPIPVAMFRTWPGRKSGTQQSKWVAEKLGVLDRIYDRSAGAANIRRLRRSAYNAVHLKTAKAMYKDGLHKQARHHYALAVKAAPLSGSNLIHLRKMVVSFLH